MADKKLIIRVDKNKENPYVMVNKSFINDSRLSYKAVGILTYVLSKPDGWVIIIKDLQKQHKDGRDSIYNGLKELINNGYIDRKIIREKGKFIAIEYIVHECPIFNDIKASSKTERPYTEKPETDYSYTGNLETEKPETEKPDNNNNEFSNNDLSENDFINKTTTKRVRNQYDITDSVVADFKTKIEKELKAPIHSNLLKAILQLKGPETVEYYLKNINIIAAGQEIKNTAGFFVSAVMNEYEIPKRYNGKVPQLYNYQQREYSEDFWSSLYSDV